LPVRYLRSQRTNRRYRVCRNLCTSTRWFCSETSKAVMPELSTRFRSAPWDKRSCTVSRCPLAAASMKGVRLYGVISSYSFPSSSTFSTTSLGSAPLESRSGTKLRHLMTAVPSDPDPRNEAPRSMRNCILCENLSKMPCVLGSRNVSARTLSQQNVVVRRARLTAMKDGCSD